MNQPNKQAALEYALDRLVRWARTVSAAGDIKFSGDHPLALAEALLATPSPAPAAEPAPTGYANALSIRAANGWDLKGGAVPVLYTDEINGQQIMRDDVWLCTTEALKSATPAPLPASAGAEERAKLVDECKIAVNKIAQLARNGMWTEDQRQHVTALIDRLASAAAQVPTHVACHQCDNCGHAGVNDSSTTHAACTHCRWHGLSPKEDECPRCKSVGTMTTACPKCGRAYVLVAESTLAAGPAARVPEGWQLVPKEPTQEMCQQGQWKAKEWPKFPLRISPIYRAMLAAAPAASEAARAVDPTSGLPIVTDADLLAVCVYMAGIGMRDKQVHDGPVTYFLTVEHVEEGAL